MSKRVYNWYISLVAASCMVLYGYDASVFNAVQGSKHWVAYFNKPDTEMIGAINTAYTVGTCLFIYCFFPHVHDPDNTLQVPLLLVGLLVDLLPITLVAVLVWPLVLALSLSPHSFNVSLPVETLEPSSLVVSSLVSVKESL